MTIHTKWILCDFLYKEPHKTITNEYKYKEVEMKLNFI